MELRKKELLDLKIFTQNVEAEVTMLLQSLQWDRKLLLESASTAICRYDSNHRVPKESLEAHESNCALRSLGYTESDELLPDPPDDRAHTLVKLNHNQIQQIINEAANVDPLFKKGGTSHQPLSLARLQLVYTANERRALHDAVVAAVPSCHDLGDLALATANEDGKQGNVVKSRVEILAELRNMKRRRTKYRVAAKTKNYSDVLRDVIKTQMESYSEAVSSTLPVKGDEILGSQSRDFGYIKDHGKSNFLISKDDKCDTVKVRDKNEERHEIAITRQGTCNAHYDRSTYRKGSTPKRYEDRYNRSDSSKRRHESHRDRHREKEHSEKSNKRYRSGSEHYENRSYVSSHKHKSSVDEENGHKHEYKFGKRYDHDEQRYSESGNFKEDKYSKDKIKVEPRDQSRESSSKKRSERSRSRDTHRDSQVRKHREEDYRKHGQKSEEIQYKRYYDVKKEGC